MKSKNRGYKGIEGIEYRNRGNKAKLSKIKLSRNRVK